MNNTLLSKAVGVDGTTEYEHKEDTDTEQKTSSANSDDILAPFAANFERKTPPLSMIGMKRDLANMQKRKMTQAMISSEVGNKALHRSMHRSQPPQSSM